MPRSAALRPPSALLPGARPTPSPLSARSSSSFAPAARAACRPRRTRGAAAANSYRSLSASARASCASQRLRSLADTPVRSRSASTPRLLREPGNGLRRGPRLAALDLAQVLLAEAAAGELGLRQTGRGRSFGRLCRRRLPSLRLSTATAPCSRSCPCSLPCHIREATVSQSASLCYLTVLDRSVMVVPNRSATAGREARHNRATFGGLGRAAGSSLQEFAAQWRVSGKTPGRRSRGFSPSRGRFASAPVSHWTREAAIASIVVLAQQAAEAVLHGAQEADAEADPRLGLDVAVGVDGAGRLRARGGRRRRSRARRGDGAGSGAGSPRRRSPRSTRAARAAWGRGPAAAGARSPAALRAPSRRDPAPPRSPPRPPRAGGARPRPRRRERARASSRSGGRGSARSRRRPERSRPWSRRGTCALGEDGEGGIDDRGSAIGRRQPRRGYVVRPPPRRARRARCLRTVSTATAAPHRAMAAAT